MLDNPVSLAYYVLQLPERRADNSREGGLCETSHLQSL